MVSAGTTETRGFVRPSKGGVLVRLRVSPGSKRTSLKGLYGEAAVKLSVAAPPVDGKANAEVGRFLAGLLDIPPSDVTVVNGTSSRDKTVFVRGGGVNEVLGRLEPLL